jgi:hypothetical protein
VIVKFIKLCSYLGLPLGGGIFLVCLMLIRQSPAVPDPKQGLVVPFAEGPNFVYISQLMNDIFYSAAFLLATGILCTIVISIIRKRSI